jgi:hypothetical protein
MRKQTFVALLAAATLVEACLPFSQSPTATPIIAATATENATSTATLAASPTATLPAATATSSPTPTSPPIIPTIPTPTLSPSVVNASVTEGVIGLSVGKTVTFVSCASTNPVDFNGTITTNPAVKVWYDWLVRGHAYFNSPPQLARFDGPATQTVFIESDYQAKCGNYTVSLHIISPNHVVATKSFSIP